MNEIIRAITVFELGDEEVGIPETRLIITSDGGEYIVDLGCLAEEDQGQYLRSTREGLKNAFGEMLGGGVTIRFYSDSDTENEIR